MAFARDSPSPEEHPVTVPVSSWTVKSTWNGLTEPDSSAIQNVHTGRSVLKQWMIQECVQ